MPVNVLLPVANGSEDMEVAIISDVLRRAGINVTIASTVQESLNISLARGLNITADKQLQDLIDDTFDMIVIPGGMPGSENLGKCETLISMLQRHQDEEKWIAAICAAPAVVLHQHDLLRDAYVTCYPTYQDQLYPEYCMPDDAVVVDEHHRIITSQSPGTAMRFAITLVEELLGEDAAEQVELPLAMLLEELEDEILEESEDY